MKRFGLFFVALIVAAILGSLAHVGFIDTAFATTTPAGENQANRLNTVVWDGPEASHGSFSSRSTSTSTSYNVTVASAAIGDTCEVVFGASVAAANQALEESCKITAANTATVRITNASGGTLTPTAGRRGVRVVGLINPPK